MTNFKKILIYLFAAVFVFALAGCSDKSTTENQGNGTQTSGGNVVADEKDMFTDRDGKTDYDESDSVFIVLADSGIDCSSSDVSIDKSTVTLTKAGTYIFSGSLSDGQIKIDADKSDKLQIVLNGASVNSAASAALYVKQADKVFVTMEKGSENSLTNGGSFVAVDSNNIDAAVFSKEDITFNGEGRLTVSTSYGHGIVSKDDLTVTGGTYFITAQKHALSGKDCVKIADGTFNLTAGKDGVHSENSDDGTLGYAYISGGDFTVNSQGDGFDSGAYLQIAGGNFNIKCAEKGIKATGNLSVSGGEFEINSTADSVHSNANLSIGGGTFLCATSDDGFHADETLTVSGGDINITKSYEGLEGLNVVISGGNISLIASDDGINAAGGVDNSGFGGIWGGGHGGDKFGQSSNSSIDISGGIIKINASGDGIDSNGSLTVSGGETYVSGPTDSGNGALDYDGTATITGGIVVAAGSSGMAQNFGSASTQGSILQSYSSQSKGAITLSDGDGNVLVTYSPEKNYNCVLVSCPQLKKGDTYTLNACGKTSSITLTSLIYGSGNGFGGGMGGGMGGGGGHGGFGRP